MGASIEDPGGTFGGLAGPDTPESVPGLVNQS
jgi:hypothetical protein